MDKQYVEKSSIRYALLFRLVRFYFGYFYRRVTITGRNRIPKGVPLIFASNHQNALMDALAVLFTANRPVVFLARADIFKKKAIAKLLYLIKILPVYRLRDGVDAMGNNQEVFRQTVRVLESGMPLALLPEGTHSSIKKLQQLKKGICRIAFLAAESSDFKLDIHLVPVGLDYTNYQNAGTHLLVNYGNPIPVAGYYDLYRENPQKAIAQLRDDLAEAIKKMMIHVENEEFYHSIYALTEILVPGYLMQKGIADNRVNRFSASQDIINLIDTAISQHIIRLPQLREDVAGFQAMLKQHGLKEKLLETAPLTFWSLTASVISSGLVMPVHLYGMIINYLPYKLPVILSGKMKDRQFISSVNFGLSFILFPVWYLLLFAVVTVFTGSFIPALLIAPSWPLTGLFTFYHYRHLRKLTGKIRLFKLKRKHTEQYAQLVGARQKLCDLLSLISV